MSTLSELLDGKAASRGAVELYDMVETPFLIGTDSNRRKRSYCGLDYIGSHPRSAPHRPRSRCVHTGWGQLFACPVCLSPGSRGPRAHLGIDHAGAQPALHPSPFQVKTGGLRRLLLRSLVASVVQSMSASLAVWLRLAPAPCSPPVRSCGGARCTDSALCGRVLRGRVRITSQAARHRRLQSLALGERADCKPRWRQSTRRLRALRELRSHRFVRETVCWFLTHSRGCFLSQYTVYLVAIPTPRWLAALARATVDEPECEAPPRHRSPRFAHCSAIIRTRHTRDTFLHRARPRREDSVHRCLGMRDSHVLGPRLVGCSGRLRSPLRCCKLVSDGEASLPATFVRARARYCLKHRPIALTSKPRTPAVRISPSLPGGDSWHRLRSRALIHPLRAGVVDIREAHIVLVSLARSLRHQASSARSIRCCDMH
ncbi:hypothetical protein DFH06DRAFT_1364762 [Mycena polygramma]|nr:hypothetical protein DFH06DRAFT_1364762 [Mycena polygramma]